MIKKAKASKDNIVKFPSKLSDLDKEIEAIIERLNLLLEVKKLPPINQRDNVPWPLI